MKKTGKYILVFVLFVLIMSGILYYFSERKEKIQLYNNGKELLKVLDNLNKGEYSFKDGLIYTEAGSLINKEYLFGGNGKISIDKYGNISFDIEYKNNHICKNKVGIITIKNSCSDIKLELEMSRNNDIVSFASEYDNLSYKISKNDDFYGNWIESTGKNIIISKYSTGTNYIWFKTKDGVLSPTYTFNVNCLNVDGKDYDKNIFYCPGSRVKLDNKYWLIIESRSNQTTMALAESLINRLYMCSTIESKYCYYTEDKTNQYKWSNSYVNDYLNNEFINELSDETKSLLIEHEICDEYNDYGCDEDKGCGGYLKEDIERKKYTCDNYVNSKIRIITYEDINYLFNNTKNIAGFVGNYWLLNAYGKDVASVLERAGNIFILEDPTKKKEVRPVITIAK